MLEDPKVASKVTTVTQTYTKIVVAAVLCILFLYEFWTYINPWLIEFATNYGLDRRNPWHNVLWGSVSFALFFAFPVPLSSAWWSILTGTLLGYPGVLNVLVVLSLGNMAIFWEGRILKRSKLLTKDGFDKCVEVAFCCISKEKVLRAMEAIRLTIEVRPIMLSVLSYAMVPHQLVALTMGNQTDVSFLPCMVGLTLGVILYDIPVAIIGAQSDDITAALGGNSSEKKIFELVAIISVLVLVLCVACYQGPRMLNRIAEEQRAKEEMDEENLSESSQLIGMATLHRANTELDDATHKERLKAKLLHRGHASTCDEASKESHRPLSLSPRHRRIAKPTKSPKALDWSARPDRTPLLVRDNKDR